MVQLINNFSLACVESHQDEKAHLMCVCDFRINEIECTESHLLRTGSWILIPYTSFIAVTSIWFLWYRIYCKKQSLLFPPSRDRGIIRPRPHDTFHLVTVSFCLLHIVRLLLLINNAYPNSRWAEILDDLPRQTSFAFSVLYLVGIIYSIPTLEPTTMHYSERFIPNKFLIDIGAFLLIIGPYIVNTSISYMIGYYADLEEIPTVSIKLFTTKYLIWVFWLTTYLSSLLYFWHKLFSLLKYHMRELQNRPRDDLTLQLKYESLKVAAINLSTVVMVFAFLGFTFILVYFIFGLSYKSMTHDPTTNVIYFFILNFVEPICLQIAQFIIVFNAVKPTRNAAPFSKKLSLKRSTSMKSHGIQTTTYVHLSEKSPSKKPIPEMQLSSQATNNDDDQFPSTPFTPYITGYQLEREHGDTLPFGNVEEFIPDEIPTEHLKTHHRRDSSVGDASIASTTYFSIIQSLHSRNNSLQSFQSLNSKRISKRLSSQLLNSVPASEVDSESGRRRSKRTSHPLHLRNLPKEESLRESASILELNIQIYV
ncbi:12015_t:CDS:2 [Funneliformis mosseae]|uniref:12015_t:CDS:1 n=1 Tax=Funneliformis mosseae TaxID=27381 RepID=A0A9N8ZL12_FUNMO|nr:12015_t:CDS:2 [Funneliformis mosseae]